MPNTALIFCLRLEENQAFFAELDRRPQTDGSESYPDFIGMLVTDPASLSQWQWRLVGNACVELKKGDTDVLDHQLLLERLHRASTNVIGEDADRFFRATVLFLEDDNLGSGPRIMQSSTASRYAAHSLFLWRSRRCWHAACRVQIIYAAQVGGGLSMSR